MKKLFSIICFCLALTMHAQNKSNVSLECFSHDGLATKVTITPFYQGKKAAISFTYDDGLLEHYTLVAPNLEKRGFRGSFWIIGNMVGVEHDRLGARMTWNQIKKMEKRGHDMGSHGWSHKNCRKVGCEAFMQDVRSNDSAFIANLGHKPLTFAYPYNSKTSDVIKAVEEGRIGSRLFQVGHGQQNNKSTLDKMQRWFDDIVKRGEWGITMTHAITDGYDKWYHPEELWQFYDYVKAHLDDVWVGTFAEVEAYQKERNATFISVEKDDGKTMIIRLDNNLDNNIFRQPLTLCIEKDGKKKYVNVKPNKKVIKVKR